MKFPSIFNNKQSKQPPKPLSFQANKHTQTQESLFLKSANFSSDDASDDVDQSLETTIGGVKLSERLFFEPVETSSILKQPKSPFKDSVAQVMESDDPYLDFKKSMHEIIESQGIVMWKDWECLEKLLGWYLRMNGKNNHGFVVGAFIDLLLGFSPKKMTCSPDTTTYYSTASSLISSPSSRRL